MFKVNIVQIRGSSFEIGEQQALYFLKTPKGKGYLRRTKPRKHINVRNAQKALLTYAPSVLEELKGLSYGLQQPLAKSIRDFSNSRLPYPNMGCSTVLTGGIYARNYDYNTRKYDRRLVLLQPHNTYATVGFSHLLTGRIDGMNEHGLCLGIHSVRQKIVCPGFGPVLTARIILEQCKDIKEAIELLSQLPIGLGFNISISDTNNAARIEVNSEKIAVEQGKNIVCTNHFQLPTLKSYNVGNIAFSHKRASDLTQMLNKNYTTKELYSQLNNSAGYAFHHNYNRTFGTLHTIVFKPENKHILIGVGGDSPPLEINFQHWVSGNDLTRDLIYGLLGGYTKPYGPGAKKFLSKRAQSRTNQEEPTKEKGPSEDISECLNEVKIINPQYDKNHILKSCYKP